MSDSIEEKKETRMSSMLFFIKSNNAGITKVRNTAYEGRLLCIAAYPNDTLMDAISNDGRFCENFLLLEDTDNKSNVSLQYKVSKYSRQRFIMKKSTRKRKQSGDDETRSSESVIPKKQTAYSLVPSKVTAPFTVEIGKSMIEDARNSALETLIEPGVQKAALDKNLRSIIQKFGKVASSAVPARILPNFTEATKSVGFIRCGDCTGTCFLLANDYVITAQHVINDINAKRSASTNTGLYKTISIFFQFLFPLELASHSAEINETNILFGRGKLDYAICHIKWVGGMPKVKPLRSLVRSVLPRSGLVILVGHPDNKEKSIETCHILPSYNWHATLCKRASEAEKYCEEHPEECSIYKGENVQCVHIHKGRYLQGDHPYELPYDTSFFHGSSGSPVFNSDSHIVAMHTQGYPIYQSAKKISLMEFGVTFAAIFKDVKERYGEHFAKKLFPKING